MAIGSEVFGHGPDVGLRKVGVIEADDRNIQAPPRGDGFPRELIRVAGFDDVRLFPFEHLFDEMEFQEGTIARGA